MDKPVVDESEVLVFNTENTPQKTIIKWSKRLVILLIFVVIAVEIYYIWPTLRDSKDKVLHANPWWFLVSVAFSLLAMHSFARVQRKLFSAAGFPIKQSKSESIIYAANAISITLPGGQVIAPAFIFRQARKLGIPTAVASWQLVMSGVMMTVGLAVLGFGGILFAGATENPVTILFSVLVCLLIFLTAQFLVTHTEVLISVGSAAIRLFNKIFKKPSDKGVKEWKDIVDQLTSVKLGKKDITVDFLWSIVNWVSDVFCLLAACLATGHTVSILTVAIAYSSSRFLVALVPWIPAGIGALDVTITTALVTSGDKGLPQVVAMIAVIIYRITRYIMIAIIGWIIYFVKFRKTEPVFEPKKTASTGK